MKSILPYLILAFLFSCAQEPVATRQEHSKYLQISGIYPHLTGYNQPEDSLYRRNHHEAGIGAVVPWADKLWYYTYPPHMRTGSNDKLHMVDGDLNLTIREESIGGTHANRFIHRETNQLIMGPYFIDQEGNVRVADVQKLEGRLTATSRHLTEPDRLVYFFDMEGKVYEVDINTMEPTLLFEKPVPGWHGKGAYTGQGRYIVANNGEHQGHSMAYSKLKVGGEAKMLEEAGVLAEWDGEEWRIIERKQFTDVTGPGGIYGNKSEDDPVWSMGWDKRSVILKLLDGGEWYTYRLPKASHTFDPRHGWFTEWPRIREIGNGKMMMVMHGMMFDFPMTFSRKNSAGMRPVASHLRYIPDFCDWNGRLILAADDASRMQNPIVGQPQSNLWFGTFEELPSFGPRAGWGGVWVKDNIRASEPSDPFLISGFDQRTLHLHNHSDVSVVFTLETDLDGTGNWEELKSLTVSPGGYFGEVLPVSTPGEWIRLKTDKDCIASAYFHYYSGRRRSSGEAEMFSGIAPVHADVAATHALIRPAGHNRSLQMLTDDGIYREVFLNEEGNDIVFRSEIEDRSDEVREVAALEEIPYEVDENSIILTGYDGKRYRLPKGNEKYDSLWSEGRPRFLREVQSERYLANISGLFYEIPRVEGAGNHVPDFQKMKPVARHDLQISDYCSWRGLLVLTGVKKNAPEDGQIFTDGNGTGLWFGMIDDVWKMGKPTGLGGPWSNTRVRAGESSDPYLMTGFDQKQLSLSHDQSSPVEVTIEVAINHEEWVTYRTYEVGTSGLNVIFPPGYHAHWVRLTTNTDCIASAEFLYQ